MSFLLLAMAFAASGAAPAAPTQVQHANAPVLTKAPKLLHFEAATYPEALRGSGHVEVTLLLTLGTDGSVTKAESKSVAPAAGVSFSDAAIAAAKKLTFSPAEVDGLPSAIQLEFRYTFVEVAASQPASLPALNDEEDATQPASQPVGSAVFSGEIREAGTRLKLAGVSVRVQIGAADEARLTDGAGAFRIENLPAGKATVTVVALKYRRFVSKLKLEAKVEAHAKYYLQRERLDPFETTVRTKKESNEVTRTVLSRDEIATVPGSLGDPLRVIQNLPGVARPSLLSGNLVIRGAAPGDSDIYFNGMQLPALYHFLQGPAVLPERMIEDVTFIPGNFGVRYGRATAGIIDVSSRELDSNHVTGKVQADTGIASGFIEVPITSEFSLVAAVRRSYIDAILGLVVPKNVGNVANPTIAPVFYDYQVGAEWRSQHYGKFELLFYGSDDRLKFVQAPSPSTSTFDPASLNLVLGFYSVQPRWTYKLSPGVTNTATALATYQISGANTPDTFYNQTDYVFSFRDELAAKVTKNVALLSGIDTMLDSFKLNAHLPLFPQFPVFPNPGTQNPPFTNFNTTGLVYDFAAYTELAIDWGRFRFVPGLRVEENLFLQSAKPSLQPRLTVRYKLLDNLTFKAGTGLFQRRPDTQNLLNGVGNPNLDLQNAYQNSIGGEWQILPPLSLEMTGFFNYDWGEVSGTSQVLNYPNGQLVPLLLDNNQEGREYGLEVMLRMRPWKGFYGWIAYTLSRSERRNPSEPDWFLYTYDQTHILTIVASYILPYGFQVGVRFRLVSGNPTTPVRGAVYDSDTGGYDRLNAPPRSGALAGVQSARCAHRQEIRLPPIHSRRVCRRTKRLQPEQPRVRHQLLRLLQDSVHQRSAHLAVHRFGRRVLMRRFSCTRRFFCTLLLSACTGSLPSSYEIHDLRVISVVADPPEVSPGDSVTLTAYFEAPDVTDPSIAVKWQHCPAMNAQGGDITCEGTSSIVTVQEGPTATAVFPGIFTSAFTYTVPADFLTNVSPLAKIYGYNDDRLVHGDDGKKTIDADKRVVVSNAPADKQNSNPIFSGFTIAEAKGVAPDVFALERTQTYTFTPSYDPSSIENYSIPDFSGKLQSFSEETSFIWSCAPSCTIDRSTTYGTQTMSLSLPADWNFGATLTVNAVMRDGRGGEAFRYQQFRVLPASSANAAR